MPALPVTTDYTDKDYEAILDRLTDLLDSVFPQWTSRQVGDFGMILLQMYAFIGDVLLYYQDAQAREAHISTATLRRSVINLAKLIGYELSGRLAATADVLFTLTAAQANPVTIPAGTIVRTEGTSPITFQTITALLIPAGTLSGTVTVENSESHSEQISSENTPWQEFPLTWMPFIEGTLAVTTTEGTWTEVDSLLFSGVSDRHYELRVDEQERAWVRFGNGVLGKIPSGMINFSYSIGGGSVGMVAPGAIKAMDDAVYDSVGNRVQLTLMNAAASIGGIEFETVASAKVRAPASLRVLARTISREDYEINAKRDVRVARALMLTNNEDASVSENAGILFIVPVGGGTAPASLLTAVGTLCTVTYPNPPTFSLDVQSAHYKTVDVRAIVYLRSGADEATVKAAINAALVSLFAIQDSNGAENSLIDFGYNVEEVALSDVANAIRDVSGVRKLDANPGGLTLNGSHEDLALTVDEFPVLGSVVLINGATGLQM